jgi:acetyl esterase/lipase
VARRHIVQAMGTAALVLASRAPVSAREATVERQVTFCTVDGVELKQDVSYPPRRQRAAAPAVLFAHGGAWMGRWGSSDEPRPDYAARPVVRELLDGGFVVIAVYFRTSPQYRFPAHIEDLKCAVRSLRANAARYGVDPQRIGVLGSSSGGHLAALMGTADASAGWDTGPYAGVSSRVQAVVTVGAPSDLSGPIAPHERRLALTVFGTAEPGAPILRAASPVTHVSPDDPPFLLVHGERDSTVPASASRLLHERLRAAGVASSLLVVGNGEHNLLAADATDTVPTAAEVWKRIAGFFEGALRR